MNRLTFTEDDDEAIETDPFTDIDEGLPVMVGYNKTPNRKKGENYYDVAFAKKPTPRPLTDAELEYFSGLKPLNEIIGKYTIADFDRALAGLQIFDEENEIGLFDDDDWLEKVEEIRAQYDAADSDDEGGKHKTVKKSSKKSKDEDEDDEDDEDEKSVKKSKDEDDEEDEKPAKKSKGKKQPEPEEDEDEDDDEDSDDSDDDDDELDDLDRSELKKFIKDKGLDITVKKSMSDDDLRDAIREKMKDSDEDSDNEDDDDEDEEDEKPSKKAASKKSKDEDEDDDDDSDDDDDEPKSKISLNDIRAKLKKK